MSITFIWLTQNVWFWHKLAHKQHFNTQLHFNVALKWFFLCNVNWYRNNLKPINYLAVQIGVTLIAQRRLIKLSFINGNRKFLFGLHQSSHLVIWVFAHVKRFSVSQQTNYLSQFFVVGHTHNLLVYQLFPYSLPPRSTYKSVKLLHSVTNNRKKIRL